jgi:DNA-binding CsgD family transcriptional regulator
MAVQLGILEFGHLQWAAELVESLVRSEVLEQAARPLETMRESIHPASTALSRALLARCEALVAGDPMAEEHFQDALSLHAEGSSRPFELARTQLCFGERLRRQRRRKDARTHLTAAWETFSHLGAATWAQRAAREIEATGVTMPGVMNHKTDLLTPQELQVALWVSRGATNRETAEALFLSQKTVEFHLSSIYRRLDVHSRGELTALLRARQPSAV